MGRRTSYEPGVFCWTDLATSDREAAKEFYAGLFGWEYEETPGGDAGPYALARLEGEPVAGIYELTAEMREQGVPPHWDSYVTVAATDETAARARELGGQVLAEPFDVLDAGRMAVIADPAGAVFMAWEPRQSIGAERVNDPGCLTWNELGTTDPAGAREFYSGLFGWSFEPMDTGGGPPYWVIRHQGAAEGRNGGMRELAPEQAQAGIPAHWIPYFTVSAADEAIARARELGGESHFGPISVGEEASFAVLADPQGGVFCVFEGPVDD